MGVPQNPPTGSALARDVALYSAARLGLVAVMASLLMLAGVPLLVSILFALVVALPLSMVLLRSLRVRVTTGLAVAGARRRSERDRLRDQLRGDR
ncbi:MAG: DUF4229 domain-containing protein [Pseudonocardiaceae bacterium]